MNWISRGATSHQLDRKCPIISHIFSSIVTLIIDCLRTGWSQLPPQAAEQAENVRQRYGKDKTEGLNALHMNTQNATRCIALIKIKHFHRPLNFRVVERVSASWWLDRRWLCSKLDAPTKFWLRKEIDFTKKMKTQYQRPFRTHFRAKQMQLISPTWREASCKVKGKYTELSIWWKVGGAVRICTFCVVLKWSTNVKVMKYNLIKIMDESQPGMTGNWKYNER